LRQIQGGAKSFGLALQLKDLLDTLTKADEDNAHTGAMVALIPREEDLHRLYDSMGEDLYELHTTVAYLGKADDISDVAKYEIISRVSRIANHTSGVYGNAFAVNIFNPNGDEPCVVLGVGATGNGMTDLHSNVVNELNNVAATSTFRMPDNHEPWIPHITLRYFKDEPIDMDWVSKQFDKLGPIVYDRVRVAFAGNNIDFPIETAEAMMGPGPSAYEKGVVITPGGRVGSDTRHNISPRDNWVDKRGGLPRYIRIIANGIRDKKGVTEGRAISLAVAAVKRWAS